MFDLLLRKCYMGLCSKWLYLPFRNLLSALPLDGFMIYQIFLRFNFAVLGGNKFLPIKIKSPQYKGYWFCINLTENFFFNEPSEQR